MVVLIDNYDSFSYNLYQLIGSLHPEIKVIRNDEMTPEEVEGLHPTHLILSPGPGRPENAGICGDVVRRFAGKVPILGVCLGHQAICQVYGATIGYAKQLMHGKQSRITFPGFDTSASGSCQYPSLFEGLPGQITVGRYHSLAAEPDSLPEILAPTAVTEDGEIMAVQHRDYPIYGLQFHPESILTPDGPKILENFLNLHYSD